MREQQELLFDKNAPSATIQEKGKEKRKKPKHNKQNEIVHSETMPAIASSREGEGLLKTPDQQPGKSTSKTSPYRFGKKSGPKVKSPSTGDIAGEMTSPEAVLTSPSKGKEGRSGKRKKHSKSKKSQSTESKEAGDSMESYDGGASPQKMDGETLQRQAAHNKASVRSIFALSHPLSLLSPFLSHSLSSLPSSPTHPPPTRQDTWCS